MEETHTNTENTDSTDTDSDPSSQSDWGKIRDIFFISDTPTRSLTKLALQNQPHGQEVLETCNCPEEFFHECPKMALLLKMYVAKNNL